MNCIFSNSLRNFNFLCLGDRGAALFDTSNDGVGGGMGAGQNHFPSDSKHVDSDVELTFVDSGKKYDINPPLNLLLVLYPIYFKMSFTF
jgi:hypothetical protein